MDSHKERTRLAAPQPTKMTPMMFNNFFKTRLCQRNGGKLCSWGSMCCFAHGVEELRPYYDLSKTKMCPAQKLGKCTKKQCRFAHSIKELRSTETFYKTSMCVEFFRWGTCIHGPYCRHAHGVEELRPQPPPLCRKLRCFNFGKEQQISVVVPTACAVPTGSPPPRGCQRVTKSKQLKNKTNPITPTPDTSTAASVRQCKLAFFSLPITPPPGLCINSEHHLDALMALTTAPSSNGPTPDQLSPLLSLPRLSSEYVQGVDQLDTSLFQSPEISPEVLDGEQLGFSKAMLEIKTKYYNDLLKLLQTFKASSCAQETTNAKAMLSVCHSPSPFSPEDLSIQQQQRQEQTDAMIRVALAQLPKPELAAERTRRFLQSSDHTWIS